MSGTPVINQDLQNLAIRGIAVQGLCALEGFLRNRAKEWVGVLSSKRLPTQAIPDGPDQWRNRIVDRLPRRFKNTDESARPQLFEELAKSLHSFTGPSLVAHDLFFDWPGSNVQSSDIEGTVSLFGVKNGWGEMTQLWKKVDPTYPSTSQTSARTLFDEIASTRHRAAHSADLGVGLLNAQSVTRHVLILALLFDCICSTGVGLMCSQQSPQKTLAGRIQVRKVKRDGKCWSEFAPDRTSRAYRRHGDLQAALVQSSGRLKPPYEIVVAYDGNRIVDWRTQF